MNQKEIQMHVQTFRLLICFFSIAFFLGCGRSQQAEIKKVKIEDIELAYYTRGSGEPLVMIMGFRGTMAIWDPALLELLEKKYQLILFDNRGAGFSTDSEEDHTTIAQMAKDTVNLIKALGFSKTHLLGWSMGSAVALEMAIHYPEVVETLIVCSPNPGGSHQVIKKTDAYQVLSSPDLTPEKGLSLIFPNTINGNEAALSYIKRLTEAVVFGRVPNDLNVSNQTITRQTRALKMREADEQLYSSLSKINRPTLVAGGLEDELDSPINVRTVANQIPFSWSAYFPGAGHNFLSQNHEHFAELVILFIESNKQNGS